MLASHALRGSAGHRRGCVPFSSNGQRAGCAHARIQQRQQHEAGRCLGASVWAPTHQQQLVHQRPNAAAGVTRAGRHGHATSPFAAWSAAGAGPTPACHVRSPGHTHGGDCRTALQRPGAQHAHRHQTATGCRVFETAVASLHPAAAGQGRRHVALAASSAAAPSSTHPEPPAPSTSGAASSSNETSAAGAPAPADYAALLWPPVVESTFSTTVDGVPEQKKYIMADEWGLSHVGSDLPPGTNSFNFSNMFPERFFAFNARALAIGLAAPLALMAAGYGWLWYMHSICPAWQQALCAVAIGTGYAGLFKLANEAARFSLLPQNPLLQDLLGSLIMAPGLYAFPSWRLGLLHHLANTNMLYVDNFLWHPLTKSDVADAVAAGGAAGWQVALQRLVVATPLKFLSSIGHWAHSFEGFDLRKYAPSSHGAMLLGWALPFLFMGLALPAVLAAGGVSGFVSFWLAPWLVFHGWLSMLRLLLHTAPHIPFKGPEDGYDQGQATVCGTVTVRLPRWLELLLNNANYALPQYLAPGLPYWHAREAYDYAKRRLGPYLTEANWNVKLLVNQVVKWQVYDEADASYKTYDQVLEELEQAAGSQQGADGSEGEVGGAEGEVPAPQPA